MINCPNCGAPINPYTYCCEYCGTYIFDTTAWDVDDNKPCYVKFKINGKIITALARPRIETLEMSSDTSYISDKYDNKIMSYITNRNCDINVRFKCRENPKTKELIRIEMGDKSDGKIQCLH